MLITRKLAQDKVSEPEGRGEDAGLSGCGAGTMARMENRPPDLNLERWHAAKGTAAAEEGPYLSDADMAQIADQNAEILKKRFDSWIERQRCFVEEPAGVSEAVAQIKESVLPLRFPERISRVMARPEGGGSVQMLIVHEYETHGEAVEAAEGSFDAIEDGVPGARLAFCYVKSDQFAAEDYLGFVDVLSRPR